MTVFIIRQAYIYK